jgi:hypothetical protein
MVVRRAVFGIAASVVALAALVALPLIPTFPGGLATHYSCVPGTALTSEAYWTPELIVNAPYRGWVNGSAVTYQSSTAEVITSTSLSNGTVGGVFVLENWTLYQARTTLTSGPGANTICSSSYIAQASPQPLAGATLDVQSTPSESQASLPSQLNYGGYPSVLFNVSYSAANAHGGYGTCSGFPTVTAASVAELNITLPFSVNDRSSPVKATLAIPSNWTYSFPSDGNWNISPTPSGGLAFDYYPCP